MKFVSALGEEVNIDDVILDRYDAMTPAKQKAFIKLLSKRKETEDLRDMIKIKGLNKR